MKKRLLSGFMAMMMLMSLVHIPTLAVEASDTLYLDCDENGQNWRTESCIKATEVESDTTTWTNGWYAVNKDISMSGRVTVNGNVHLILMDNSSLTVNGGVYVCEGNSLTIYAQSTGSSVGRLISKGEKNQAGIGGKAGQIANGGTITINGGVIQATGGTGAAGIGAGGTGSSGGNGGAITINGGDVTAVGIMGATGSYASQGGAGIGGSDGGSGGIITINGGKVSALSKDGRENITPNNPGQAAGIGGGGGQGGGGTISITGGEVYAEGHTGIGGSSSTTNGTIVISGGCVTATGKMGGDGVEGSFSTGANGTAIIMASGIQDRSSSAQWRGLIFDGGDGMIGGSSFTLWNDVQIPSGKTLTVREDVTLTIPADRTLTNQGTLISYGRVVNQGTLNNSGIICTKADTGIGNISNQGGKVLTIAPVPYLDERGASKIAEDCIPLSAGMNQWKDGWYVARADELLSFETCTVSGDVRLILENSCQITVTNGIQVKGGGSLAIYAQSQDEEVMGRLIAGNQNSFFPAIGSDNHSSSGTCAVTISGGRIDASSQRVGIGGSGCSVTVNGGVLNIAAGRIAIGADSTFSSGDSTTITINGGVIHTDVSSGYGVAIGTVEDYQSSFRMNIVITGGTVELEGNGNSIYAGRNRNPETAGTCCVTITGGSVKAGDISPAPTDGKTPVYAVTVETGKDNADVGNLALEESNYGIPAKTDREGKLTLYLPVGQTSGAAVIGGEIVMLEGIQASEPTEGSTPVIGTARPTGIHVTTPEGTKPTVNPDGGVSVPEGGFVTVKDSENNTTVITPPAGNEVKPTAGGVAVLGGTSVKTNGQNNPELIVGSKGGTVNQDGGVSIPGGGGVTIQSGGLSVMVTVPSGGGTIAPQQNGGVQVPPGCAVRPQSGPEITVNSVNGTVGTDGSITVGAGGSVTVQGAGGSLTITGAGEYVPKEDGGVTVPGGAQIELGTEPKTTITIPSGGEVKPTEGGGVTIPGGSTVKVGENGPTVTLPEGGGTVKPAADGGVEVPPGSEVTNSDGTKTIVGEHGGTVSPSGTVTDKPKPDAPTPSAPYIPPTYPPTVVQPGEGGSVAVSPSRPERGDTVTIKPKPGTGYEVDKVTVTDKNGKTVEVTRKPDGTYAFTQPVGKVRIEVTYRPIKKPWSNPFADVTEGDWYYDAVRFVSENGLMNGYDDGLFRPDDNLSRAQLAQILFNREGGPVVNFLLQYSDVATGEWYTEAIRWAASQGIVGGYGNGQFGPDDPVTREQLAVVLWRYSGSPKVSGTLAYSDSGEVSGWAKDALVWAQQNQIMQGSGGKIRPGSSASRAEVAQFMMNYTNYVVNKEK